MVETSFNLFDAIVLGIVFLSTLLSFFRGFVRELLSLGSWIGAMIITVIYTPDVAAAIQDSIDKGQSAALLVASVMLFFGAKMLFAILNAILMKYLRTGRDVGLLDNFMGLVFGFLRAALLISLAYYVYGFITTEDNQPPWIAQSYTRPYVSQGAQMLEPYLRDLVDQAAPSSEDSAGPEAGELPETLPQAPGDQDGDASSEDFQRLMQQLQQQRQ